MIKLNKTGFFFLSFEFTMFCIFTMLYTFQRIFNMHYSSLVLLKNRLCVWPERVGVGSRTIIFLALKLRVLPRDTLNVY